MLRITRLVVLVTVLLWGYTATAGNTLSVISWNIWFDDETGRARYPQIIESLKGQNADVVALQEVTPLFLEYLKKSGLLRNYSLVTTSNHAAYQNIFLSRNKPFIRQIIPFTSSMSRSGLLIGLKAKNNKTIFIVNVHLESPLDATGVRLDQLSAVHLALKSRRNVIATGDFNYGTGKAEDLYFRQYYRDAGGMPRYKEYFTYNVQENPWATKTKYYSEKSRRLDRFYIRLADQGSYRYQVLNDLVSGDRKLPLSDHYAIRLDLDW